MSLLNAAKKVGSHSTTLQLSPGGRLLFVDRPHLTRAVVAAVSTHAVGGLRLAALRAHTRSRALQRVVRAALAAAGLGVSAFWIRHRRSASITSSNQPTADRPTAQCRCREQRCGWFRIAGKFLYSPRRATASSAAPGRTVPAAAH